MAHNDKRIVDILLEQCEAIEERYPGYRAEMKRLVAEVLRLERENSISRIPIAQKIGDQVNTLGMDLHKSDSTRDTERSQL